MCYHIALTSPAEALEDRFQAQFPDGVEPPVYHHVSAFAHPEVPVITGDQPQAIQLFRWGLIPGWVKNEDQASDLARMTLNARGDSMFEKPSFKQAAARRRCLILVDGFYEWMHQGGKKYPFFIQVQQQKPFALGGLWETWTDRETGEVVNTCSVVTLDANPLMARIHNTKERMPFVLPHEVERQWIREDLTRPDVEHLMRPVDDGYLRVHTVSPLVSQQARKNTNVPEVHEDYTYAELAEWQ
ncbi:Putative SOS response-associated peptidase YedK [Catalinimonas alkaloidigena]|uniref:Abasic site processing protein n=1 Tax=Catalinimonas alkaloidigena TaxID=1075417 RepID=A0A1G9GQ21_9BACT|nr:SOS response-associated peptidase [Catalinimonas alkaloidigena]SDL02781.1 Putative SOS response-associated peptidase YedK [Catalinimonas alkaloidigena]